MVNILFAFARLYASRAAPLQQVPPNYPTSGAPRIPPTAPAIPQWLCQLWDLSPIYSQTLVLLEEGALNMWVLVLELHGLHSSLPAFSSSKLLHQQDLILVIVATSGHVHIRKHQLFQDKMLTLLRPPQKRAQH